jgi:sterol desaturase/sphingolipid hydroxylase (fatty acid hydroxylase superfamily)
MCSKLMRISLSKLEWVRAIFAILSPLVAIFGIVVLENISKQSEILAMILPSLPRMESAADFFKIIGMSFGIFLLPASILVYETIKIGYKDSSLKRLLNKESASANIDYLYFLIRCSGLMHLLAYFFSIGLCFWLAEKFSQYFDFGLMRESSFIFQFITYGLLHSLLFYWSHRLMHTRFLWEIHKVHHSAREMNIVTPFRNHPVDMSINLIIFSTPIAIFGFNLYPIMLYSILNGVYQCLVHSNFNNTRIFWENIFITPEAHRIHHSTNPIHWGKNYGILTIWDKLFRTYYPPKSNKYCLKYGVKNDKDYNNQYPIKSMLEALIRKSTD